MPDGPHRDHQKKSCEYANRGVTYGTLAARAPLPGRAGMTKEDAVMVSLTDGAVNKFKEVVTQQGAAGDGVRIFVVPGG